MLLKFKDWKGTILNEVTVKGMITQAVNDLLESGKGMTYSLSGNTLVLVTLHHGDIEVWVSEIKRNGRSLDPTNDPDLMEV